MEQFSDKQLIEKLPSDEAFRALAGRHSRMVYSVCLNILRDPDRADDAVQSVFIAMLKRANDLKSHASIAGWLYVTATNIAKSMNRKDKTERLRDHAAASSSIRHRESSTEEMHDVLRALNSLRSLDRELVLLRFAQGMSFDEIASRVHLIAWAVGMPDVGCQMTGCGLPDAWRERAPARPHPGAPSSRFEPQRRCPNLRQGFENLVQIQAPARRGGCVRVSDLP